MDRATNIAVTVDYQDPYVEPLILDSLKKHLPKDRTRFLKHDEDVDSRGCWLQWRTYETIDFERALLHHSIDKPHIFNAYIIRKALIRKHYLAHTVLSHVTKHPSSILKTAFPTTVDFELDYAEFLDEALAEAFELRESFERNVDKLPEDREWWILKPSMSDRGQGIRLFSTEDDLRAIFEAWEAELSDSDDDENDSRRSEEARQLSKIPLDGIVTSHLRHFVAQRYVESPLLFPQPPFSNRKFHVRTYVVAAGALKVYVYDQMLALFASEPFAPLSQGANTINPEHEEDKLTEDDDIIQRMKNIHLTNTCIQAAQDASDMQNDSVHLLSSLPLDTKQHSSIRTQICAITSELFTAALAFPTNFQPLPQAFEIFGVDFMCSPEPDDSDDNAINVHLLEVNAFPDFGQTGDDLKDTVVGGLFEQSVQCVLAPMFHIHHENGIGRAQTEVAKWQNGPNSNLGYGARSIEGRDQKGKLQMVLDIKAGMY
ncbi:MAG: hypothetical protein Q9159_006528 [Coniocarpon cinnabarinum]